jgi:hypothetical protein
MKPPKVPTFLTPEYLARNDTEDGHQMALFQWFALNRVTYPLSRWLYAIPNGGYRPIVTAMRMKATGAKKGVPDTCLPVPIGGYAGLYVELKPSATKGRTSDQQDEWAAFLASVGYATAVAYGWEHARDVIVLYIGGNFNRIAGPLTNF